MSIASTWAAANRSRRRKSSRRPSVGCVPAQDGLQLQVMPVSRSPTDAEIGANAASDGCIAVHRAIETHLLDRRSRAALAVIRPAPARSRGRRLVRDRSPACNGFAISRKFSLSPEASARRSQRVAGAGPRPAREHATPRRRAPMVRASTAIASHADSAAGSSRRRGDLRSRSRRRSYAPRQGAAGPQRSFQPPPGLRHGDASLDEAARTKHSVVVVEACSSVPLASARFPGGAETACQHSARPGALLLDGRGGAARGRLDGDMRA